MKAPVLAYVEQRDGVYMHFTAFIRSTASPGLVIIPQSLGVREAADTLILMWVATELDEWNNRIVYLPI